MNDSDSPTPIEPPSLMDHIRRNHRALLAGSVMTLSLLGVGALVLPLSEPQSATTLMMGQLVIMMVFMPAAAYGASRPIDVIYRSGVTTDCFGAFMLALSLFTGAWGIFGAIKLYLLVTGCGLMLMGAYVAVRRIRDDALTGSLGMFVVAVIVVGFHGLASAGFIAMGDGGIGKLNLLSAGLDAIGVQEGATDWRPTVLIYGATAGLFWAVPLLEWPLSQTAHHDDESTD